MEERPGLVAKRRGGAEEVAAAVVFLCSERASDITGELLRVDGASAMNMRAWLVSSAKTIPNLENSVSTEYIYRTGINQRIKFPIEMPSELSFDNK